VIALARNDRAALVVETDALTETGALTADLVRCIKQRVHRVVQRVKCRLNQPLANQYIAASVLAHNATNTKEAKSL